MLIYSTVLLWLLSYNDKKKKLNMLVQNQIFFCKIVQNHILNAINLNILEFDEL